MVKLLSEKRVQGVFEILDLKKNVRGYLTAKITLRDNKLGKAQTLELTSRLG
jgi:hypothetical protein